MTRELGDRYEVDPAPHQLGTEGVPEHVWPKRVGTLGVETGEPSQKIR